MITIGPLCIAPGPEDQLTCFNTTHGLMLRPPRIFHPFPLPASTPDRAG
jgi:hypothetical protein